MAKTHKPLTLADVMEVLKHVYRLHQLTPEDDEERLEKFEDIIRRIEAIALELKEQEEKQDG